MTSRMTFSIPDELKKKAQRRSDVNWSGVVAKAIDEKLSALAVADRIASPSQLTEADVEELSEMVNRAMAKRLGVKS